MISINSANLQDLLKIVHIGPKTADLIIKARESGIKFKDLYELSSIRGLGRKKIDSIVSEGIASV